MKIRRIASLTAAGAFLMMMLTSVILFVVPQGRVAYWADWRLWGLTKTDWGNIHINLGLLFLIALSLHVYYNWKPLLAYLKNKGKEIKVFTPEFNLAMILLLAFTIGTYLSLLPFSWVLAFSDSLKDAGAEKYGEPPYGHAELSSLKTFAKKMNLDLAESLKRLERAGYSTESSNTTLAEVARKYKIAPRGVYETIKPAKPTAARNLQGENRMSASAPPGTGNRTLADLCAQYNLSVKRVIRGLKKQGVDASEALTIKKIAALNQTSPTDVYEQIKSIARKTEPTE